MGGSGQVSLNRRSHRVTSLLFFLVLHNKGDHLLLVFLNDVDVEDALGGAVAFKVARLQFDFASDFLVKLVQLVVFEA